MCNLKINLKHAIVIQLYCWHSMDKHPTLKPSTISA